ACADITLPAYPVAEATLHVSDSGPGKNLVGGLTWGLNGVVNTTGIYGSDGVAGEATYPIWGLQTPAPDPGGRTGIAVLHGLPRERAGCQQVAGTLEVEQDAFPCTLRYAGTWSWYKN